MFARISAAFIYVLMAFTVLAAATCTPTTVTPASTATQPASQCNTGPIQCCNTVQSANSSPASGLLGLLDVTLTDLNVLVGLNCSPITILGGIFGGCSATPVCCQNNFNGVIAMGCVPVNLSLRK